MVHPADGGNGVVSRDSAFGQIGAIAAIPVLGFRITMSNDRKGVVLRLSAFQFQWTVSRAAN